MEHYSTQSMLFFEEPSCRIPGSFSGKATAWVDPLHCFLLVFQRIIRCPRGIFLRPSVSTLLLFANSSINGLEIRTRPTYFLVQLETLLDNTLFPLHIASARSFLVVKVKFKTRCITIVFRFKSLFNPIIIP